MRRPAAVLSGLIVVLAGCGGGDENATSDRADTESAIDASAGGNGDGDDTGADDDGFGQRADFDLSSLPDDFPDALVPPDWDTGQFSDITGFATVTFESSLSFDDAVAHYDAVHGEGIVVGEDEDERLAQWTRTPPWIVSVFEGDPLMIGITKVPDE